MNYKIKLLVGAVATVAVVGGATAAGLAYANPTDPTPTPGASPSSPSQPGKEKTRGGGLLGRALHGEATVRGGPRTGGETRVIVFQRGTVTSVSATSVELRSADGFTGTYAIEGEIRVRTGREKGELGDVAVDQTARLLATKNGETLTAKRIIIVP